MRQYKAYCHKLSGILHFPASYSEMDSELAGPAFTSFRLGPDAVK